MTSDTLASRNPMPLVALLIAMPVACVVALAVGNGNLIVGLAPLLVFGVVYAVCYCQLRTTALALLFISLTVDYIPENPYENRWNGPLVLPGKLFYVNLNGVLGGGAPHVPLVDIAIFTLVAVALYRQLTRSKIDPQVARVRALDPLLWLVLLTIGYLEILGIAQGDANVNESLWQVRHMAMGPMMAYVYMRGLHGKPSDYRAIFWVLLVSASVKSLMGIFFIYFIVRPSGLDVEFATSHSDTLLFVIVLVIGIAYLFERPVRRTVQALLLVLPLVFMGMVVNDRRISYVSLGFSLIMVVLMNPWTRFKRAFMRFSILIAPVLTLYFAVGWTSKSPIFYGAHIVRTLIKGEENQQNGVDYRDIENFDLLATWNKHPLLGSGFGHIFIEPVKLPDISRFMPTYAYHPHDTILWLWGVGGVIGFTGLFLWAAGVVYLAARIYRFATRPDDRTAALAAIAIIITYLNQCFGDMGTLTYYGPFLCSLATAIVCQTAVRVGAFPAPRQRGGA